ncbi:MAG: ferredoxin [Candidatus Omnitrophica bacterium]|nr:ferredoxin [Candidatus Omnitrophota bacterium]
MANIVIDENACVGCALCVNMCPDRFEMDEGGIAKVKNGTCDCDLAEVATQCPVDAITIQ